MITPNKGSVRILAVGDIVGRPGRNVLSTRLQGLIDIHKIDYVIANGENASGGISITPDNVSELLAMGVNFITTGNHIWDKSDVLKIIDEDKHIIRPANYPDINRGKGYYIHKCKGINICIINLQGRVHMASLDCPFRKFDEIYEIVQKKTDIIIVDFHAEATSEKKAFGWYVDGRASLVYGTHTHVQTSDEEILPRGTGYITDIGMTGAFDSVIGMDKDDSISKFLSQARIKYRVAKGNPGINGIIATINRSGKTEDITRVIEL